MYRYLLLNKNYELHLARHLDINEVFFFL